MRNFFKSVFGPSDASPNGMIWVFTLGGFFIPLVSLWNSRAIVPLVALMAVSSLYFILRMPQRNLWKDCDKYLFGGICIFLFSVILAAFQVADPHAAIISASKLFGIVAIAIVLIYAATHLDEYGSMKAARCVLLGISIVGVFFLCDILSKGAMSLLFNNMTYTPKYKFFWFKSASAVFAVCTLIVGFYFALKNKYWVGYCLAGLSIFIVMSIGNRTAAIGIILGLLFGVAYQFLGRWRHKVLSTLLVIAFTAPFYIFSLGVSAERISQIIEVRTSATISVVYRMYAWEFVTDRIIERPVRGWGLGGSKKFGGETAEIVNDPIMGDLGEPVPLHPHNGILQIWLELGAAGALAVLILGLRATYLLDKRCKSSTNRIWTFSVLALLMCFFAFSYSAFSSAWLALVAFSFAMVNALSMVRKEQNKSE